MTQTFAHDVLFVQESPNSIKLFKIDSSTPKRIRVIIDDTKLNEKEHFSLSKIDRDGNKVLVGRMPYVYSRNPSKIFKKHYVYA